MAEDGSGRRRSRRRATARQGPPAPAAEREPVTGPTPPEPVADRPAQPVAEQPVARQSTQRQHKPRAGRSAGPRGERDLAGSGNSQLGPTGAMRARDLNRPTAADLAEAEAELEIVRRNWAPAPAADEPYRAPRRRRK